MISFNVSTSDRIKNQIKNLANIYGRKFYSQEGEDAVLNRLYDHMQQGFYVDVGAHHPKRFSNTYFFYRKGWHGINIDAVPGSMEDFKRYRPRDINIEAAVGNGLDNNQSELSFYIFSDGALNTFDATIAERIIHEGNYQLLKKIPVKVQKLAQILDQHMPANTAIDFMSIDVEGMDFQVVQSNNWSKYRPKILLLESHDFSLVNMDDNKCYQFLKTQGYSLFAKTVYTLFFKADEAKLAL